MRRAPNTVAPLGGRCCGCGACAATCPKGCISMVTDGWGFPRPSVDESACVGCSRCITVCPVLFRMESDAVLSVFWARSRDERELARSSSGGVFGLLAADVIVSGGLVVGAAWDPDFRSVSHRIVGDFSDLDALMRSKYVQSSVPAGVYRGVRDALRLGRRVLFSGTACQIAGMRSYLGPLARSDFFLTVDVICHGVPAPVLWSRWVAHREAVAGAPLSGVNMRSKTTGWSSFSASYEYGAEKDGVRQAESAVFRDDWYFRAFLSNASLRPSCLACPCKRTCGSDLTLGDYWGVESVHPEVNCEDGVSAVICNTGKGVAALKAVSCALDSGPSEFEKVLAGNPALTESASPHKKYAEFMHDVKINQPMEYMVRKYRFKLGPSSIQKAKYYLGRVAHEALKAFGARGDCLGR